MSFNIRDIDAEYVRLHGGHYNYTQPRQRQGQNRIGGYRPLGVRAPHDQIKKARDQ